MHDGVQPDLSVTQQVQLAEKRKMEDNTMAKRKSTMIYKSIHRKLEIEQRESHKNRNEPVHRHGKQFCYTIDTRRVHCRVPDKEWSFQDGGLYIIKKVGVKILTIIVLYRLS